MCRLIFILLIALNTDLIWAQNATYVPFAEANKAIEALEKKPKIYDSLKRVYDGKWSLGLEFGQRFITKSNLADSLDVITFTDFTERRSFFGLEGGYFVTKKIQAFLAIDIIPLPRKQEFTTFSIGGSNGIEAEGSGSGGAMINFGIGSKFFVDLAKFSRLYIGLKLGRINAVAVGGIGGFTIDRGRYQETTRINRKFNYGNGLVGLTHRFSPTLLVDLNLGYLHASRAKNIGGIISPGGITTTLTLQFFLGKTKK